MKRLLLLLLILVLPLVGCELQNRQDSEDFIPTGTYNYRSSEADPAGPGDPASRPTNTVKTVRSYSGEIPMTKPARYYSYELPMIDLSGAHAAGCNQDIESFFGLLIEQSLDAMKNYQEPILERLSYTTFTRAGILTLRVDRRDYDGASNQAWYTVDKETGEAVSVKRLFAAAGISGDPETALNEAVLDCFTARYGALEMRFDTVCERIRAYLAGEIPVIDELEAERLYFMQPKGGFRLSNDWSSFSSLYTANRL